MRQSLHSCAFPPAFALTREISELEQISKAISQDLQEISGVTMPDGPSIATTGGPNQAKPAVATPAEKDPSLMDVGGDWEKRLSLAVPDVARGKRPRKYDAPAQARVIALARSPAPGGRSGWTGDLLLEAARKEPGLATISQSTIYKILKKNR